MNSYVYYLTRGFIVSTLAFNLLIHVFNLPTRAFNLATRTSGLLTRVFELVARGLELITHVLLFHSKLSVSKECFIADFLYFS